jgi:sulfate transport system ATP-binding protein
MSVVVKNVSRAFVPGGPPAVASASFTAPAGAITALLGPSGAGKSTVLRIIAGLEFADGGDVWIEGERATDLPPQKRNLGFVFQSYALFDHMTVRANIAFGLRVRGIRHAEVEARVAELLELVRLSDLGERYPSQLSGGQRQRVALARSLAPRPRVLLLDEPFGALDPRVRTELRTWLSGVHQATGVTTVLVTHDHEEAFELAQHVVLMNEGRVVQSGAPASLFEAPASPFVRAFLDLAPSARPQLCPCCGRDVRATSTSKSWPDAIRPRLKSQAEGARRSDSPEPCSPPRGHRPRTWFGRSPT